jgi:tRNA G18 (ribose-2'-O)-methylase SpoU
VPISFITDPADPRLDDYRNLQDRRLNEEGARFIAESELVVRDLLGSGFRVHSVLLTAPRLNTMEGVLGDAEVLVAPQEVLDGVTGFHVHRGCLAIGERPAKVAIPDGARAIVVLEDLVDVDNVGAMVRNAAALGADAVVLSPRCADPFYRKAIRVSMGTVFRMPIVRATTWPGELQGLRERGFTIVGAVLGADAVPIESYRAPARFALVLGTEGPGLSGGAKQLCDARVTIPMKAADSLNVATAGAVLLHQLIRGDGETQRR